MSYKLQRYYFSKPNATKDERRIKLISLGTYENAQDLAEILRQEDSFQPSRPTRAPKENYTAFDLCYQLPNMKRIVFAENPGSQERIIGLKAQKKGELKDLAYQLRLPNPLTFWENLTIPLEQLMDILSNFGKEFKNKEFTQP
jgi:hypothetical protein